MDSNTVLVAIAGAVLAFAAMPASAAPPDDACALLTAAKVSSVVGVTVGSGQHVTPTYVKTCTWTPTAGAGKGISAVTVSYQAAASFSGAKQMSEMMTARGKPADQAATTSASGIGDDAFYTTMNGRYTALLVKKGNVSFKVAIYGEVPVDKAKAMEKSIALQALSKV